MKIQYLLLLAAGFVFSVQPFSAQEVKPEPPVDVTPDIEDFEEVEEADEPGVFIRVERMPYFPKCEANTEEEREECHEQALLTYIAKSVRYPEIAKEKGINGLVVVSYVVSPTGKVEKVNIMHSAHPILDEEALRVIRALPVHKPGRQRGKAVPVQYTVPVKFNLM